MLKCLTIESFTVLGGAAFNWGQLNVLHGENGTGKTHVLKLAYALAVATRGPSPALAHAARINRLDHAVAKDHLASLLADSFRPQALGRLVHGGASHAKAVLEFGEGGRIGFTLPAHGDELVLTSMPVGSAAEPSVFFPAANLLFLGPGFPRHSEKYASEFDQTWIDFVDKLYGGPPLRQLAPEFAAIELQLCGDGERDVRLAGNQVFMVRQADVEVEAWLAAEGVKKLAELLVLIRNGFVESGTHFFWDEPEANLNPALLRVAAKAIVMLAHAGVQVFVATHSLMLMRELYLLNKLSEEPIATRWFGLHRHGSTAAVTQGNDVAESGTMSALDEELRQSELYLDVESGLRRATKADVL